MIENELLQLWWCSRSCLPWRCHRWTVYRRDCLKRQNKTLRILKKAQAIVNYSTCLNSILSKEVYFEDLELVSKAVSPVFPRASSPLKAFKSRLFGTMETVTIRTSSKISFFKVDNSAVNMESLHFTFTSLFIQDCRKSSKDEGNKQCCNIITEHQ